MLQFRGSGEVGADGGIAGANSSTGTSAGAAVASAGRKGQAAPKIGCAPGPRVRIVGQTRQDCPSPICRQIRILEGRDAFRGHLCPSILASRIRAEGRLPDGRGIKDGAERIDIIRAQQALVLRATEGWQRRRGGDSPARVLGSTQSTADSKAREKGLACRPEKKWWKARDCHAGYGSDGPLRERK